MTKHMEDLYEEAEHLSENDPRVLSQFVTDLINNIELIESIETTSSPARQQEVFGDIIFSLCAVSKILNINAYEALQNAMNKIRTEILDD